MPPAGGGAEGAESVLVYDCICEAAVGVGGEAGNAPEDAAGPAAGGTDVSGGD